jgi:23S rRNA (uracil1939-C5)-methyltransferase
MTRKGKKDFPVLTEIEIVDIAEKANGVGRHENKVLFIEKTVPGDIVDIKLTKKKKDYGHGTPVLFHKKSSDRIEPKCTHFGTCGGCQWQNLNYEKQLEYKNKLVIETIKRLGKVEVGEFLPILGAPDPYYYRNKLEFGFSNKRWLTTAEITDGVTNLENVVGFHVAGSFDKILDIDTCHLQQEPSNKIRNTLRKLGHDLGLTFCDLRNHTGFIRQVMIRTTTLNEVLVIFCVREEKPELYEPILNGLLKEVPSITSLYLCINGKVNDFMMDLEMRLFAGKRTVTEELGDIKYEIGPKSFFQTNTKQTVRLFDRVKEFAELTGKENVYDLYCGLGSITLYLAEKCKSITGIEEIPAAIEDAKSNATLNKITNATFFAGDVKVLLDKDFISKHGTPDVIITDPPRVGMHEHVVNTLLEVGAKTLVYVSCNPATMARDLNLLSARYTITKLQPVDMFPQTHHVESIAQLKLKS